MRDFSVLPLFAILSFCICTIFAAPRVTITSGILEGSVMESRKGRAIYAFRGIPYARPPVGELRFQQPQPPASWTGVRSAKSDADVCLQPKNQNPHTEIIGSEDCLYINVYTPKLPNPVENNTCISYAVMVWFHGGRWSQGSGSSLLHGPQFLLDHDVVLVAMNYRLGPLGFLSTADGTIPGNYALKDHVQALRWVQENIAAFGGNPSKVTITGHSAGAVSVHYLLLSPLAKGLFHRAISQSGSALAPFSYNSPKLARDNAHRLARELYCPTDTSEKLVQCLRTRDASNITAVITKWPIFNGSPYIPFRPVKESNHSDAFIADKPSKLIERGQYSDVAWLTGVVPQEGSLWAVGLYSSPHQVKVKCLNDEFLELAPILLEMDPYCPRTTLNTVLSRIRHHYIGDKTIDESTRMNLTDMISDAEFKFPAAAAVRAQYHASKNDVYFYQFGYRSNISNIPHENGRDYGITHGDDLLYLFPSYKALLPDGKMSKRDFEMVNVMTMLWTNFAIFGEPVLKNTSAPSIVWNPVKTDALETFMIESPTSLKMSKNIFKNAIDLWSGSPCRGGSSYTSKQSVVSPIPSRSSTSTASSTGVAQFLLGIQIITCISIKYMR